MKRYPDTTTTARHWLGLALIASLVLPLPAFAASVALATSPLANATTTNVKPNLMFILDDSGSMSWTFLPDAAVNFRSKYGYLSSQCNGVYYNPGITYLPPLKADGTSYPNASFAAAWNDGFNTAAGTTNLGSNFYANRFVPEAANSWYSGWGSYTSSPLGPFAAYYYTYSGTQTTKNYNTGSIFYKECISSIGSTTKVDGTHPVNTLFTKVTVNATSGPGGTDETQNFANWYSYYRTHMLMMKTSVSRAFSPVSSSFRVGYMSIDNNTGSDFLNIKDFDSTQKAAWYAKVFAAIPYNGTPLRSTLSTAGLLYGGMMTGGAFNGSTVIDPVQYSCQQNFSLMATDGYWNTGNDSGCSGRGGQGCKLNKTSGVGDQDGGTTPRPMYEGPTSSSDSLADVAKYYYDTDLRTASCTGGPSTDFPAGNPDVCTNNVFVSDTDNNVQQHMTTFTLGLGVDGTLTYTSDYKTATSGDYFAIKTGTKNWPVPAADTPTAVDDLWHAAVNGQGTYFSAKDPVSLASGLSAALAAIKSKVGAGAAAATSTLNPVTGDNLAYVASYTTVKWQGNLEARSINVDTGVVSADATWCVEDVVAGSCVAPGSIVADTSGSSVTYNCVTPGATLATCLAPGVLDGTNCKVPVATSCTGTMAAKFTAPPALPAIGDNRTIYMSNGSGLMDFTYANLTTAGLNTNFDSAFLGSNLSQWTSVPFTAAQQTTAAGANLVKFLRGQKTYENRTSNPLANRLFRFREAVMGDAVESKPTYSAKPTFSYTDPGYSTFVTAQASRPGTVYLGTNEGMLHAFDATTGNERWAYVPTMVIPNMWKLADMNYSTMHTYYVNGDPIISDICSANCSDATTAVWRTILVGGLNGGGRGYYALDITDPNAPKFLWEFTPTNDNDLGYTFGNPVITKKSDGTWVVLVTSGYNNTTGSNPGKGFLYVLNAMTGAKISKIPTGVGDATTPSGLAKIASWVDNGVSNNTAGYTYGGDLLGNVWRFDINAAVVSGTNPLLFATLKDSAGNPQSITTRPELGLVRGKRVVFVGTGKYLELSDLTNTQQQTLYAIKDDNATVTLVNPRTATGMVQQTITTSGASRTATSNLVNFTTGRGWYVDFPDSGERQNVAGQLILGTLLVPTTVPSNTVCSPGGYSWLNYFDYLTGGPVDLKYVSSKTNAPIVGFNVIYIKGKPIVSVVTSDHPTPTLIPGVPFKPTTTGFQGKRTIWRELIQ